MLISIPGIQCPNPGVPSNGRRIGNDFRAGMIVFFFCNDGFQIEGEQLLLCLENGEWNNDTPNCTEIDSKSA
jgi:CUB/sushi domain-containing protein